MPKYITRGELHRLVWLYPCNELATVLGVKPLDISAACVGADIPKPKAGHWAKRASGQVAMPKELLGDPDVPVYGIPVPPGEMPEVIQKWAPRDVIGQEFAFVRNRLVPVGHGNDLMVTPVDGAPSVLMAKSSEDIIAEVVVSLLRALRRLRLELVLDSDGWLKARRGTAWVPLQVYDANIWESPAAGKLPEMMGPMPLVRLIVTVRNGQTGLWSFRSTRGDLRERIQRAAEFLQEVLVYRFAEMAFTDAPDRSRLPFQLPDGRGHTRLHFKAQSPADEPPSASAKRPSLAAWTERVGRPLPQRIGELLAEARAWRDADLLRRYAQHLEDTFTVDGDMAPEARTLVGEVLEAAIALDPVGSKVWALPGQASAAS